MVRLEGGACVLGALALLTLPLNWLIAMIAAAAFHEACHALTVRACGGKIWSLCLGVGGAELVTSPLERRQELLCALAGPLGSLALVGCLSVFPRLAVCGLMQGLFNLLPLFPLDGGRILRCLTPGWSDIAERGCGIFLLCLAIFGAVWWKLGLLPVILSVSLLIKRKNPCKSSRFGVQ